MVRSKDAPAAQRRPSARLCAAGAPLLEVFLLVISYAVCIVGNSVPDGAEQARA